jgi:outer membrane protein OmpA-like peptidoglycan-associated protein/Tol biopolymer transport system component
MKPFIFIIVLFFSSLFCFSQKNDTIKVNDTLKVVITNPGKDINSAFPDYAPIISADGELLIFTSRRPVTDKEKEKNKESKENIYSATYSKTKDKWHKAVILGETVNEPGRHNSAIAISNDGQLMLLYRDDANGNGDIWESKLHGKTWSAPEKMPEPINSTGHESSASFSPDGKTIYFISDRPGGHGGLDIWMCTQDDAGKWGKAKNLGTMINTSSDEEGVFMHPDGKTIYFSSKGHKSTGGYDIYKSVYNNSKWSEPENLGSYINTAEDDVYFVCTADGKTAYYSSVKKDGLGANDIYVINFISTEKETGPALTLLKGTITDEITGDSLESTIVIKDLEKNEEVTTIYSNNQTGKYLVSLPSGKNYGISVNSTGYLFHSENVNIPLSTGYQEIIKDVQLKKIEIGKKIVLNNIFYDFDKSTLRSESISELDRLVLLMTENPTIKIELSSHTDNVGSDEYNMTLSQARAQAVVDYVITKGIDKDRLVAKGYGESTPIATNDTEEGRQQNRRTEFKILSK